VRDDKDFWEGINMDFRDGRKDGVASLLAMTKRYIVMLTPAIVFKEREIG
jgi:hypothetical protein